MRSSGKAGFEDAVKEHGLKLGASAGRELGDRSGRQCDE